MVGNLERFPPAMGLKKLREKLKICACKNSFIVVSG